MATTGANHMVKWPDKVYSNCPTMFIATPSSQYRTLLLRHAFNISMLKIFKVMVKGAHVQDVARSRQICIYLDCGSTAYCSIVLRCNERLKYTMPVQTVAGI